MPTALITGISGMDGSHMADLLLSKGYKVYGMERHKTSGSQKNIEHILNKITIVKGDLADTASLYRVLEVSQPDEIFNFASQSFVGDSWMIAEHTGNITGLGVVRLLQAVKTINPKIKVVQASSSEMFGLLNTRIANEQSPFLPNNPYGVAKLYAHNMVKIFRESYDMFVCSSICYNHESTRRGHQFVTRKISDAVAKIHHNILDKLTLGDLTPKRDWGYAPEYVIGIWKMLQLSSPQDFVFATGKAHSVEEFVCNAFKIIGIDNWRDYVVQDPKFMRPTEVRYLCGDYSKAKQILGWEPKVTFEELVHIMVDNDIKLIGNKYYD